MTFTCMFSGVTSYKFIINVCIDCVQFSSSVFSRISVNRHIKQSHGTWKKVCPKDFTSNQPQGRWVDFKSDIVIWESQNHKWYLITTRKNQFYSSAGGVKLIFSSFKILSHSRRFEFFKNSIFNGHINGQNPWIIWNMVRFRC